MASNYQLIKKPGPLYFKPSVSQKAVKLNDCEQGKWGIAVKNDQIGIRNCLIEEINGVFLFPDFGPIYYSAGPGYFYSYKLGKVSSVLHMSLPQPPKGDVYRLQDFKGISFEKL